MTRHELSAALVPKQTLSVLASARIADHFAR